MDAPTEQRTPVSPTSAEADDAARAMRDAAAVDPAGGDLDTASAQGADLAPQRPAAGHTRWEVLRHRHFRNIWIAAFFSWIGTWMESTGVSWVMGQATLSKEWIDKGYPAAPTMMAWHAVAQLAPTLVLGLAGGAIADRVNRKKLLLITQVMLMGTAASLALCAWLGVLNPWVLLIVGFAYGCIVAFNIPAWQVLTPRLVPKDELPSAIMLNGMMFNLARALGPVAAGYIMHLSGTTWLFAANTASFVGVILVASTTPDSPAPPKGGTSYWHDVREALTYTFSHTGTRVLIISISLFSMLSTPMLRYLPLLVSEVYHEHEDDFGALLGMMGGGAVLGGILMRYVPAWYPRHHLVPVSITLGGLSLVALGLSTNLVTAMISMVVVGIFWMWAFNSAMGALQLLLDDRLRGRVLSICNVISFGSMPLGSFIAAGATDFAKPYVGHAWALQWGILVPAIALTLVGLWMLRYRTPEIDGLKPGDYGHDRRPGMLRGLMASAHRPGAGLACPKCDYPVVSSSVKHGMVRCPECGANNSLAQCRRT